MGLGDLSFSALYSLRTIDTWLAVLNANADGTAKVGFRGTKLKFGGDSVTNSTPLRSPELPARTGEQSLAIAQTATVFEPGSLVNSIENTHFAIDGRRDHFFLTVDKPNGAASPPPTPEDSFYLTRDGEFTWGEQEADGFYYLRNSEGHYVFSADATNDFTDGAASTELVRVNSPILFDDLTSTRGLTPATLRSLENSTLEFSEDFGSTYFQWPGAVRIEGDVANGNANAAIDGRNRFLQQFALEGSNTTLTEVVPQLALAQKFYSAVATLIKVTNANVDETLRLIR